MFSIIVFLFSRPKFSFRFRSKILCIIVTFNITVGFILDAFYSDFQARIFIPPHLKKVAFFFTRYESYFVIFFDSFRPLLCATAQQSYCHHAGVVHPSVVLKKRSSQLTPNLGENYLSTSSPNIFSLFFRSSSFLFCTIFFRFSNVISESAHQIHSQKNHACSFGGG